MIKCAAIKSKGKIFIGHRHPDIIRDMKKSGIKWNPDEVQGFVDEKGKFYNRKDALEHFKKCGQKSVSGKLRKNALYSEDLY